MNLAERIQLLQGMPFFGAIKDSSITLILELSQTLTLPPGDFFFHQNDYGDSLFILERGQASIFKEHQGKEYIMRYVNAGDCFGDLALIDLSPRSASVRAETECTSIRIPASALHSLYQQDAEQFLLIQMNMAREVSRRLRTADDRWFQLQIANSASHSG